MTTNKAQKQSIRTRMTKTGERYTTARHYLLDLHTATQDNPDDGAANGEFADAEAAALAAKTMAADPPSPEEAALPPREAEPGVGDAAVQKATGKVWDEWFILLDAWGATTHTHTEIARHVYETYGIDGWWAQNVTVGYERARGMRAIHERPDGFSMNASKTFPVPVERLFAAFTESEARARWLDGLELRQRTSQPNKSARFDVLPGDTRLAAYFVPKGAAKSSVQLQVERLPAAAEVDRWRGIWKEQLARLADYLAHEPGER